MIRVVHIISGLQTGGAETMLGKLLSRLDPGRFLNFVIGLNADNPVMALPIESVGVGVSLLGMRRGFPDLASTRRLVGLCRRLRPGLLQGWMYHGNLAAQFASAWLPSPAPVLWNIRGTHCRLRDERWSTAAAIWASARLAGRAAAIINNSRTSAEEHTRRFGFPAGRWKVIPNGFDTERFRPSEEARVSVRAELGLAADAPLIGLFGRYHPAKDHETFLRAASALCQTRPDVRFVLAGTGVTSANDALTRLLTAGGAGGVVHLLGERQDMARLSAALDIGCSASRAEGFSNVVGEAMSCGVPCVVTNVGDSAWVVGDTGLTVAPGDPDALCSGWRQLLALDAERRRALGVAARERVERHFSLDSVARQYSSLYESLARQPIVKQETRCAA